MKKINNIKFYGLLHLANAENNAVNVVALDYCELKLIYLRNAVTLSKSLADKGLEFVLLTNNKENLFNDIESSKYKNSIKVEEIKFNRHVPSGIRFYSAHFKLDVYEYLASKKDCQYLVFVDLDMIAIGSIPQQFYEIVENRMPIHYDISSQVIPVLGHDVILKSMQKLNNEILSAKWSGGELLAGPPEFFSLLSSEIEYIYEKYLNLWKEIHHQGDEMITSVALERLRQKGTYIFDAGLMGIVVRFWSSPTLHKQGKFRDYSGTFLLHLPSDKKFLSKMSDKHKVTRFKFLIMYRLYLILKKIKLYIMS